MKKLIAKTALITFGVAIILGVSMFGILSFCAPATMMDFTLSLGMETISADYAYQAYKNSSDLNYLERSFVLAAENGKDSVAKERFEELYQNAGFEGYCEEQDLLQGENAPDISCRDYLISLGLCVNYRESTSLEEKVALFELAKKETKQSFPKGNPVLMLVIESVNANDKAFCEVLKGGIDGMILAGYQIPETDLLLMTNSLQEVIDK